MTRECLGTRLGFILLSAGCAIGLGNVWKFPYMTGQYGGGIFVLIYIFCLCLIGLPILTAEFSLGRASRKSPVKMLLPLEPKGTKWHLYGYGAFAGNIILMMFYTVVAGWLLRYFTDSALGVFSGLDTAAIAGHFTEVTGNPIPMIVYTAIVIVVGFLICGIGLKNGLERITKYMMIVLLFILIVLAGNSFFMDGCAEGLSFYLYPDLEKIEEIGLGKIIFGALSQSFFTLSIGIGAMAIFGSYIKKDHALIGESLNVVALDTFVAIMAGVIIFPTCFTYGVEVGSGPSLIFVTLPNIFANMAYGRLWGTLFFAFMSFAALSTVFTVFEAILACACEQFRISRRRSSVLGCIVIFILSLPCIFGFNILSGIEPLGPGTCIQDLEDFIVSNLLLPIGSLIFLVFCVSNRGWGWKNFIEEANTGKGLKFPDCLRFYMTYILPVIVVILLVIGLYSYFS